MPASRPDHPGLSEPEAAPDLDAGAVLAFLKSFSEPGSSGAGYLEDHLKRFVETLRLLPPGGPGRKLLELGAAYHHITPSFFRFRGWTDVTCTDLWEGESTTVRTLRARDGSFTADVRVDNFDVEGGRYPYEDDSFDVVVCCEILEHLSHDPMHMMREIHRILRPGGQVLLTTPNLASAKSFAYVLQGQSPYVWGQYPVGGRGTDRHNREYTALEVRNLLQLAGFRVETLATQYSWWPVDDKVFDLMRAIGASTELRGDNTFALARRAGPPQCRYPAELYHGGEVGRELPADDRPAAGAPAAEVVPGAAAAPSPPVVPLRLLVVNNIVPNHDRGGSCFRMMTLLKLLREDGHEIEYLGRDAKGMERYVRDLEELGIRVHGTDPERLRVWDDVTAPAIDVGRVVREGKFDAAILVLWFWASPTVPEQYLHEIRRASPRCRVVVLSDDVHWLHDARMATVTGRRSDLERAHGYRAREIEIFRRADFVAAITDDDAALMREDVPDVPVDVVPHFIPPRAGAAPGFEKRRDVVTVGAFGYHANVDAVTWFVREVWPLASERLPGVRLHVVGGSPPREILDLAREDVVVTGWVPDIVAELDRRRVFVSAIRYGTGLKTKNIQAMGSGIPVVGTTISLAGSGAERGVHAWIEDDPQAFAAAVVRLYTEESEWTALASAGRRLAAERFGRDAVRARIRSALARAAALAPAAATADDWSISRIERTDPEIRDASAASERFRRRLTGHLREYGRHLREQRPEEAIEELRRLLSHCGQGAFRENPSFFAGVMSRFGDAYLSLGRLPDAVECYREALALDPREEDARRGLRDAGGEATDGARRPEPVAIEGRRRLAFLCPALDGEGWAEPLAAYVASFRAGEDVSLLVLGPPARLTSGVLAWIRDRGLDEATIPDVIVLPAPEDPRELPRFVAAADLVFAPASPQGDPVCAEATRQGIALVEPRAGALREAASRYAPVSA